ncbi:hypothetical protein DDE01_10600 [Desulfovibrio desulfuricans]|nr:hypothetical protein DDE01_10600 [Desulfovibrio desulfuricans]
MDGDGRLRVAYCLVVGASDDIIMTIRAMTGRVTTPRPFGTGKVAGFTGRHTVCHVGLRGFRDALIHRRGQDDTGKKGLSVHALVSSVPFR